MYKFLAPLVLSLSLLGATSCSLFGGGSTNPITSNFDPCTAYQIVVGQQIIVEQAPPIIDALHTSKKMTDAQYASAKTAYSDWKLAQASISSVLLIINDSNGSPSAAEITQFYALAGQIASLVTQISLTSNLSQRSVSVKATAAATCTVTDDQIKALATVPDWT